MTDTTIFYHEWLPLINSLPSEKRLKFYDLIFSISKNCEQNEHVFNLFKEQKIDIDFSDNHFMSIFNFVCQKILENNKKYKGEIEKRKLAGIMSGKARREKRTHVQSVQQKGTHVQSVEQKRTKRTDNVNDNDIYKKTNNLSNESLLVKENTQILKISEKPKKEKFQIPTLEEIKTYAAEAKLFCSCEKFLDHFTANGWKQSNGNAIKDWKAALRNWDRNEIKYLSPEELKIRQQAMQNLEPKQETEIEKIRRKIIEEQGLKGSEIISFQNRFSKLEKGKNGLFLVANHPHDFEVLSRNYGSLLQKYSIKVVIGYGVVEEGKSLIN